MDAVAYRQKVIAQKSAKEIRKVRNKLYNFVKKNSDYYLVNDLVREIRKLDKRLSPDKDGPQ